MSLKTSVQTMPPKVSVIIPAYNVESYITQAIDSALQQTERNLEVIVVDDASTDKTLEVIKSIQDPRLHVLVNQHNLGAAASRNLATEAAQGEWIALLDADDWFAPERLEKLLEVTQTKPDADLISDDLYYINESATSPWSTLLSESDECIDDIRKIDSVYFVEKDIPVAGAFNIGLTKPIFRKDFILENEIESDARIKVCSDFWFCLSCLAAGANFYFTPKPYYFYRSRTGSLITTNKSAQLDEFCQAAQTFLSREDIHNNPELVRLVTSQMDFIEHKVKPYYRVVDRLKTHEWWAAVISMVHNPYFFVHFWDQSITVFMRRFRRSTQSLQAQ